MTLPSPRGLALPPRGGQKNVRGNSRLPTLPRLPRRYEPRERLNINIVAWRAYLERRQVTWRSSMEEQHMVPRKKSFHDTTLFYT